jgi:hypothetical protein
MTTRRKCYIIIEKLWKKLRMVNKELVYFMTVEFQDEQYAVG